MCNPCCIEFGRRHIHDADARGKTVIEVGALDVNGSMRSIVDAMGPTSYVGVDIIHGPGVDELCAAEELVAHFGEASFDLVISTEVLEHVHDWRRVVSNLKRIMRPNGTLVITTRSFGFPHHAYPIDFWRYEVDDMKVVFSDCVIEAIDKDDPSSPGVFVKVRKPVQFVEANLDRYELHSMLTGRRCQSVNGVDILLYRITQGTAVLSVHMRNRLRRWLSAVVPAGVKARIKRSRTDAVELKGK